MATDLVIEDENHFTRFLNNMGKIDFQNVTPSNLYKNAVIVNKMIIYKTYVNYFTSA